MWDGEGVDDLVVTVCNAATKWLGRWSEELAGRGGGSEGACFTEAGQRELPGPSENLSRPSTRPRAEISWGMAPSAV